MVYQVLISYVRNEHLISSIRARVVNLTKVISQLHFIEISRVKIEIFKHIRL